MDVTATAPRAPKPAAPEAGGNSCEASDAYQEAVRSQRCARVTLMAGAVSLAASGALYRAMRTARLADAKATAGLAAGAATAAMALSLGIEHDARRVAEELCEAATQADPPGRGPDRPP